MTCPRCHGFSVPVLLGFVADRAICCWRCVLCGSRYGEPILDLHAKFSQFIPPPSRPEVHTPVYDPTHRRLLMKLEV